MTFDDFTSKLMQLSQEAPDQQTRDLAKQFVYEISSIVFVRDPDNAEKFIELFD